MRLLKLPAIFCVLRVLYFMVFGIAAVRWLCVVYFTSLQLFNPLDVAVFGCIPFSIHNECRVCCLFVYSSDFCWPGKSRALWYNNTGGKHTCRNINSYLSAYFHIYGFWLTNWNWICCSGAIFQTHLLYTVCFWCAGHEMTVQHCTSIRANTTWINVTCNVFRCIANDGVDWMRMSCVTSWLRDERFFENVWNDFLLGVHVFDVVWRAYQTSFFGLLCLFPPHSGMESELWLKNVCSCVDASNVCAIISNSSSRQSFVE